MTANQSLDDAAEARIREACGRHRSYPTEHEHFSVYLPSCTCPIQRAAILTDREARETKLRCEAVMCPGCDAMLDVTLMHATVDGDVGAFITQTEPGKMPDERTHADALAEASRGFLVSALRFYSASPTPSYDERFEGAFGALREVLAAHDKRRGRG